MSVSKPIGMARSVWLIALLAMRRQANVWQTARFRRKKEDAPAKVYPGESTRTATPTKSRGRSFFSIFILLMLAVNGFNVGSRGLVGLSAEARNVQAVTDKILVRSRTMDGLVAAEEAIRQAKAESIGGIRGTTVSKWNRYVDELLLAEVRSERLSEEDETSRLQQMHEVFEQKGAEGFARRDTDAFWVSGETWPKEAQPSKIYFRATGLIVLLWMAFIVFGSLGTNNKNLGEVEWNFEWMYTFPVSARALFVSKLCVYSFLNPLIWVFFYPFLVLVYVSAGYGWGGLLAGLGAMLYLALLAGAICTFLEVALRKLLTLSQLKNIQAAFTVVGTVSLLLIYAACLSKPLDDFLVARASAMPNFMEWNPLMLPLAIGLPSASAGDARAGVAAMILLSFAICGAALVGSEWMTRDGLVKAGGPYQGTRKMSGGRKREGWLSGVAAQEMLLLRRDRNLFVQVLVSPLLVPLFYLLIYSGMVNAVSGNFRHAAVMAFGVGAYSFLSSALPVLSREDKTIWQLYTFPQSLESVLLKKTAIWAMVGLLYGAATLLLITRFSRHLHAGSWAEVFLALYGIALYAFIAGGIGILATNILETERRARFRTDMTYLYMILAAAYANTIYSPTVWAKLAQLVLSTLLAFALWQKVKDAAPYILDPVALPPRRLSLADGLIAALAFFVMQGLLYLFIHAIDQSSPVEEITLAYIFAGLIVAGMALYIFWRQDLPDLWKAVGVSRSEPHSAPHPAWVEMMRALALGVTAGIGALLYLKALNLFPQWHAWKTDAELSSFLGRGDRPVWMCVLAIVAAPIFEEFLFRGLIFRGLMRTGGATLAVLGSAALFALVHPPISVIPVFGLGLATAISFRKSGFLLAPILTHAVYNTIVIFLNKY
jgi:membrane protease YdiL (CAAX protease family)